MVKLYKTRVMSVKLIYSQQGRLKFVPNTKILKDKERDFNPEINPVVIFVEDIYFLNAIIKFL